MTKTLLMVATLAGVVGRGQDGYRRSRPPLPRRRRLRLAPRRPAGLGRA